MESFHRVQNRFEKGEDIAGLCRNCGLTGLVEDVDAICGVANCLHHPDQIGRFAKVSCGEAQGDGQRSCEIDCEGRPYGLTKL